MQTLNAIGESTSSNCQNQNQSNESNGVSHRDYILNEAKRIINGERQGAYGAPEDSFQTIANLWMTYLAGDGSGDIFLTPVDVANMMILLKMARASSGVYMEDNYIDICGYAALAAELEGRRTLVSEDK